MKLNYTENDKRCSVLRTAFPSVVCELPGDKKMQNGIVFLVPVMNVKHLELI